MEELNNKLEKIENYFTQLQNNTVKGTIKALMGEKSTLGIKHKLYTKNYFINQTIEKIPMTHN